MIHVVLACILAASLVQTNPISIGSSGTTLQLASSRLNKDLQMVFTLKGKIGSRIKLSASALSPEHIYHTLELTQHNVKVTPDLPNEKVVFNFKNDGQYMIALTHEIQARNDVFIPIEVEQDQIVTRLLLPALDFKMHQINFDQLFQCHHTLIYVQPIEETNTVHLGFFTRDRKESIWAMQGDNWQHQWRHAFEATYYGGAHRKSLEEPIRVTLTNGNYCEFDPTNLPSFPVDKEPLEAKPSYRIEDLLWQVPAFKMVKPKEMTTEQL